jgi:hypothetical protein
MALIGQTDRMTVDPHDATARLLVAGHEQK